MVEILDPIPPGLPRAEFRRRIETAIEAAADRLIREAAVSPAPPPDALAYVRSMQAKREHRKNIH